MTIPHYLLLIPETAGILRRPVDQLQMLVAHRLLSVMLFCPDAPPYVPLFEAAYAVRMVERRGLAQAKRIAERRMIEPDEIDTDEVAYARGVLDGYIAGGARADPMPYPYRQWRRPQSRTRSMLK